MVWLNFARNACDCACLRIADIKTIEVLVSALILPIHMYYVANFSAKDKVNIYLAVCKSLNEPNRTALNECIQCRTLKYRASLIRAYVLPQKANTDFSRSASRCMLCIYTLEIPSVLVHFFLLYSVVDFSFDFSLFLVRIFLFPIAFALIPYTNILILQIPSQMLFFM